MRKVFFDTWGWVAIAHKNDSHNKEVTRFYNELILNKTRLVTSDYILAESITLLRARTELTGVTNFFDTILTASKVGGIIIEKIDNVRWQKSWELSKKYKDKPHISFHDFSSFVVMKELGIKDALTADRRFEEIGMGFRKLF
jgi:predicted nucleic acid-binding protein